MGDLDPRSEKRGFRYAQQHPQTIEHRVAVDERRHHGKCRPQPQCPGKHFLRPQLVHQPAGGQVGKRVRPQKRRQQQAHFGRGKAKLPGDSGIGDAQIGAIEIIHHRGNQQDQDNAPAQTGDRCRRCGGRCMQRRSRLFHDCGSVNRLR
ncbi:hypothetical protein D3C80_1565660 [compost metagenome]